MVTDYIFKCVMKMVIVCISRCNGLLALAARDSGGWVKMRSILRLSGLEVCYQRSYEEVVVKYSITKVACDLQGFKFYSIRPEHEVAWNSTLWHNLEQ